jgi:flagellar basal-body rod protein FlgC
MRILSGIEIASSALSAQKTRLDIVAQNIANAQTTRGVNGQPYQRRTVSFETELVNKSGGPGAMLQAPHISKIGVDRSPGQRVFEPQHPDAGPDGYVVMPNVNLAYEMVDLMTASRAYEANLSVVKNSRQMAMKALDIGK